MKKEKSASDIFTTPLTERGYILDKAFNRVYDMYFSALAPFINGKNFSTVYSFNDFRLDFLHIMAVMYLYGSDFKNIHFPYDKKRKKIEIHNASFALPPSFCFTQRKYRNRDSLH